MNYMKLIKLMYLADRKALLTWGRPITFDRYVCMRHGPVLSGVLDRVNEGDPPGESSFWHRHINRTSRYQVGVKRECAPTRISDAEARVLKEVFEEHGRQDRWALVEHLHDALDEWKDPGGSSLPIEYRDILLAAGRSEMEAASIVEEIEQLALLDQFLD